MYNYNNNWINISNLIYSIVVLECIVGDSESAFRNSFFQRIGGIHSSYAYSIMTSASRVKCVKQCLEDNGCLMITYKERNRTCGLSDKWLNDVGVTASADVNSDVYFDTDRFETVIISTPDVYDYYLIEDSGVSVSGVPFVLFQVQACNDVHILLCQDRTRLDIDIFEIVLGGWGNAKSAIRMTQQGNPVATYTHQVQPLSCDTSGPFWISWFPGYIQIGAGRTIGTAGFLSTPNSQNININYVAVSTGWGATGIWTFNRRIP